MLPMNAAICRRATSSVMLLVTIKSVLKYSTGGKVMCCKGTVPCRTTKALVKAAKLMVIAAKPTQIPVLAGGGEE